MAILQVRIASLRWIVGIFLALIGAMMLVTPHRFSSIVYAVLQPQLTAWGVAFLLAGVCLSGIESLKPARPLVIAIHLISGAELISLAYSIALVGGWTGTSNFGMLGLGTLAAAFLPQPRESLSSTRVTDLFALTMGLAAAVTGLTILAFPEQFSGPIYDVIRPYALWFGVAFLVGGIALASIEVRLTLPRPVHWAGHLLAGGALLAFLFASAIPLRAWIGIAYYGGLGTVVSLLPWLKLRLQHIDPTSLQARLALAFALAISLPLVIAVAIVGAIAAGDTASGDTAAIEAGRDLSFLVLLLFIAFGAIFGMLLARWLASPLHTLARAADRLAVGDVMAPLPSSGLPEIARLTGAFAQMRDRLEARRVELATVNKELEAFSYSVSHDLRAPLVTSMALVRFYCEITPTNWMSRGRSASSSCVKEASECLSSPKTC